MQAIIAALNAGLAPRSDHTIDQPLDRYGAADHVTWRSLFLRQRELLPDRVSNAYLRGLDRLDLPTDHVPDFAQINQRLSAATGWQLVAVPGVLPWAAFFEHLAARRFPTTWWIRRPEDLDYSAQPDVFHDVFGHAPLLIHPVYADYLQAFGEGGLRAAQREMLPYLARLYWHTVEFGLISGAYGLRIYGSSLVSSRSEMQYALESTSPNRIGFDLARVMRTRFRTNGFQKSYFVVRSYRQLMTETRQDFAPVYEKLRGLPVLSAGAVQHADLVLQHGDRLGWSETPDQ